MQWLMLNAAKDNRIEIDWHFDWINFNKAYNPLQDNKIFNPSEHLIVDSAPLD